MNATPTKKITLGALAAVLLLTLPAGASSPFALAITPSSTISFTDSLSGASTAVHFPTACTGTVTPSWPTGTLSNLGCNTGTTTGVTAAGKSSTVTVSVVSGSGSFSAVVGGGKVLAVNSTLSVKIVADDGSFSCTATSNSFAPDFSAAMSPTLPLPPPQYVGTLALVSHVATPAFATSRTCSSSVALALNTHFATLTSASLGTTYSP